MRPRRRNAWLEPHVTPIGASIGVVVVVAVLTAVALVHRPSAGVPPDASQPSLALSETPDALAGGGAGLATHDRAAASAIATQFVWSALATLDDSAATQRLAVRPYDTDALDAALGSSPLSGDFPALSADGRVDSVTLLVAQAGGVDARVRVSSASAPNATATVALTLRRGAAGWRVEDVVAS